MEVVLEQYFIKIIKHINHYHSSQLLLLITLIRRHLFIKNLATKALSIIGTTSGGKALTRIPSGNFWKYFSNIMIYLIFFRIIPKIVYKKISKTEIRNPFRSLIK